MSAISYFSHPPPHLTISKVGVSQMPCSAYICLIFTWLIQTWETKPCRDSPVQLSFNGTKKTRAGFSPLQLLFSCSASPPMWICGTNGFGNPHCCGYWFINTSQQAVNCSRLWFQILYHPEKAAESMHGSKPWHSDRFRQLLVLWDTKEQLLQWCTNNRDTCLSHCVHVYGWLPDYYLYPFSMHAAVACSQWSNSCLTDFPCQYGCTCIACI